MLEKIAAAAAAERKAIFLEASEINKIPAAMIEKDFWVCWTLNRLFSDIELQNILCFKGGTSLSKVFKVIERFSEDIDLILDWDTIANGKEIYQPSHKKQKKLNDEIREKSNIYISTTLKNKIERVVSDICSVTVDETNCKILQINYPKGLNNNYLLPHIKLEIGPLAAWTPNKKYIIKPYIDGINKNIQIKGIEVPTIILERTFWEKITILHREHYRPDGRLTPIRYSRHYYDLYKIGYSDFLEAALARTDLLTQVVDFKKTFYTCAWARYDLAKPGNIELLPTEKNIKYLKDDYAKMKGMIFGDYPSWEEIIDFMKKLENKINSK
jgi:hypothetical protein